VAADRRDVTEHPFLHALDNHLVARWDVQNGGYACGRLKTQVALRDRLPVSLRPRYPSSRLPTDYVGMAKAPHLPMTLDPVRGRRVRAI
jgi:hypothetical protein